MSKLERTFIFQFCLVVFWKLHDSVGRVPSCSHQTPKWSSSVTKDSSSRETSDVRVSLMEDGTRPMSSRSVSVSTHLFPTQILYCLKRANERNRGLLLWYLLQCKRNVYRYTYTHIPKFSRIENIGWLSPQQTDDPGWSVHAISMPNYQFIKNTYGYPSVHTMSMHHGCPFEHF